MIMSKINSRLIGSIFAITLLIPPNYGLNFYGINFEDIPLIGIFLILLLNKLMNLNLDRFDKSFLTFFLTFVIYTSFFMKEINLLNQTNLRFYFYFALTYLCVDYLRKNNFNIIEIFQPLVLVMIANFVLIIFQIELPGTIDGWISNNTDSTNPLTSGRLGGFQGGGPNVIGIICAISSLICIYNITQSNSFKKNIFEDKLNSFFLIISLFNLYLTFSRGSYLAFVVGLLIILLFSNSIKKKSKIYLSIGTLGISLIAIFLFPSIFLKQSNRGYLSSIAIINIETFNGTGGGNYIKEVYKDYLVTLDDDTLIDKFDIEYSANQKKDIKQSNDDNSENPVEGYLKMKFDYRDNILPRSVVSFFFSNTGNDWVQIGSNHTSGVIIDLFDNSSFFEVGGWADGQSPGGSYLDGFINDLTIEVEDSTFNYYFTEANRDSSYFIFLPASKEYYDNRNDGKIVFKDNGLKLKRPRSYWIAIPNETNLSGKDFEITLNLQLNNIPKGNETLFSQSSILKIDEKENNQSWKWSIVDGKMYFFWVDDIQSGYSNFLGGQSLRSGQLIADDGKFNTIISEFSLSQFDEITTSHNGFLTMAVEYGLIVVLLIILLILYSIFSNFKRTYDIELALFFMLLTQNLTNDLVYAPDVAIYFWLIPLFLFEKSLRINN
tara:strand:+ start:1177 stop:3162 length:1986 start_codon:yes stop_codon:yes gene_type:complete